MKTCVIYARYSSNNQTEQSIEGQIRVCREYAQRNDIAIVGTYIDRATTGTNDNREQFQKMLKDSDKKAWDYVLCYKLDRFSRNKYEMAIHRKHLKDNGVKILSAMENIPDSPEGILLESLLEGMNQYYSAELSQKIKRGMRETRLKGHFQGGCLPYGYKLDNHRIIIDEKAAEYVRFIYTEYSKGVFVRDIISRLNDMGVTHLGKPFNGDTIYNILRNKKYSGIYFYGGDELTGMYPQIVPTELYEQVRAIVNKNKHGKRSLKMIYLLRGKLFCGYCGMPMNADSSYGKYKNKYYYKCRGRKNKLNDCTKTTIRKEKIEQIVLDAIIEKMQDPQTISNLVKGILSEQERQKSENISLSNLLKEQAQNETALKNIMIAIESGIITNTTGKRIKELEKRQEELEQLIATEKSKQNLLLSEKQIREYYEQALRLEPQMLINYLVQKVVLYDDKVEIYFNSPLKKTGPDESQGFLFSSNNLY